MIEKNKAVFRNLKNNFDIFPSEKFTLINDDAIKHLKQNALKPFDLVFMDPPFATDILSQALKLISKNGYISNNSKIYIESELQINNNNLIAINNYQYNIDKQTKSGNVHYCLISIKEL